MSDDATNQAKFREALRGNTNNLGALKKITEDTQKFLEGYRESASPEKQKMKNEVLSTLKEINLNESAPTLHQLETLKQQLNALAETSKARHQEVSSFSRIFKSRVQSEAGKALSRLNNLEHKILNVKPDLKNQIRPIKSGH